MLNFKFIKPKCGIINTRSAGLLVSATESSHEFCLELLVYANFLVRLQF